MVVLGVFRGTCIVANFFTASLCARNGIPAIKLLAISRKAKLEFSCEFLRRMGVVERVPRYLHENYLMKAINKLLRHVIRSVARPGQVDLIIFLYFMIIKFSTLSMYGTAKMGSFIQIILRKIEYMSRFNDTPVSFLIYARLSILCTGPTVMIRQA